MNSMVKPMLRGRHAAQIKKNIAMIAVVSISGVIAYKYLYMDPKHRRIEEFYKNYDPETKIDAMCDAGLLQSCGPNMVVHK